MMKYRKELEPLRPYVPGKPIEHVKKEFGIDKVVKLASNENPYGCSDKAKEAVYKALESPSLYPDGSCLELREAVADKYGLEKDQLVFGCGADEIISMIGKVFVDKGDECITAETTFGQYAASVLSMGGKMIYSPMKDNGYDLDDILNKITDKTRAIFIANPNNPTGTVFSENDQKDFLNKVPDNVLVVIDEAYKDFADNDFPNSFAHLKNYKNLIVMRTFSKAYGLASLRVGYGVMDRELAELFEKIRNPFNVSVPGQSAAIAALADEEFVKDSVRKNKEVRDYVCSEFDKMGLSYIPSHANFVMVDIKKHSKGIFEELMKKGYIIRPGFAFGMDTYLRVSLGEMEDMKGFIEALKSLL